jgi:hypothetical protein
MRSDCVSRPQTLHARFAQAGCPRYRPPAPGSSARSLSSGQAQGRADGRGRYCRRLAPPPGSVFKPFQAFGRPTFPPATDRQQANALFSRYSSWLSPSAKTQDDLALKHPAGCWSWPSRCVGVRPGCTQSYLRDITLVRSESHDRFGPQAPWSGS